MRNSYRRRTVTKRTYLNRVIAIALSAVMIATGISMLEGNDSYAATKVIMGHAATGENGLTGQTPGDQTNKEVYTCAWDYNSSASSSRHWTIVIRCIDANKATKMAKTMKDACDNPHVGYDKGTYAERQSFYTALKAANWDASAITKDVETSCTPLIAACINAAGISMKTDHSASSLATALKSNSQFQYFTTSDYTASSSKLRVGDILLATGSHQHGAMIVSVDGSGTATTVSNSFKAGVDYQLLTELNVRSGAGTGYAVKSFNDLSAEAKKYSTSNTKAILNKGTVITCIKTSGDWIQIPSGWICGREGGAMYVEEYTGTSTQVDAAAKAVTNMTAATAVATPTPAAKATTTTTSTKFTLKVGKDYKLKKTLNVRKGPGTKYKIKKKSSLSKSAKKQVVKGTKYAKFKKGTVVTCLEKKGNWIRIPSGWICAKSANVKMVS